MTTTTIPCRSCGKILPAGAAGRQCPYCLLQLGLSSGGSVHGSVGTRTSLAAGKTLAERFVRQGVLPSFDDYELEGEIARGGMGVVYRARQRSLNRVVAIKMILAGQLATPESVQRFRLEAQAAARLQHPGIVPIYEIGECETQHYFSMELIDGASLAECLEDFRLKPDAPPSERRQQEICIADLLARVARALDFAHQRGVLHRDLKPSNILIDEHGHPRLTDFGLAKLTGHEAGGMTLSAAVLGTPGYLAPEQAAASEGEVTTAADVYGLGATLYELLTGRPPFLGATALATMMMAVNQPPMSPRQINPAVHRDLETIALRCLEKAPERRYHSAAAVADELERFLRGEPITARPVSRAEHVARWCRRNPLLAGSLLLLLIAITGGGAVSLWQWQRAQHANVALTQTVADLRWTAIDDMLRQGHSARALATVASLIRENPRDANAAMFAMSVLEQHRFPVAAAPPIRHPGGAELWMSRISPDGTRIITASFDGTARIWDSTTSQEITPALKHDGAVTCAEFSPDGNLVATGSADKTVRLWDAKTGRPVGQPARHGDGVVSVRFSPDGRHVMSRTRREVCILDGADGRVLIGPLKHEGTLVAGHFLAGGATFFAAEQAGEKSCIHAWDVASGSNIISLQIGSLKNADVSDDQSQAVIIHADGRLSTIDLPAGASRKSIDQDWMIDHVAFSPRGDRIFVISHFQWARVLDARTLQPITGEFTHFYLLEGASFFHDGKSLLTWGDDALAQVWDVNANQPWCEPMRHEHRVVYGEAGRRGEDDVFLTTQSHFKSRSQTTRTGSVQLWTTIGSSNPGNRLYGYDRGFDGKKLSPDSKRLALAWTVGTQIRVLDLDTGAIVCGPMKVHGGAWGLFFSPDGSKLVSTTSRGQVALWSIPAATMLVPPVEIGVTIQPAETAPDGKTFATGSPNGTVRLWDFNTLKILHQLRHGAEVHSLAFSPDGKLLASAGGDRTARIWDTSTGTLVRELNGHQNEVMVVFFSPDGRRLVTSSFDFTARIWDVATGKTLSVLPHQGEVMDVAYSPDGRYVATASRDRTAVIWDANTGLPHSHSLLHEQAVRNVRFSPDGRRLFTMEFRGLRAWDVESGHPLTVRLPHQLEGGTAFQASSMRFDCMPDGSGVVIATDSNEARLWRLSDPPPGAPPWFAQFLESVAGERFTAGADRPEPVATERFLEIAEQVRQSTSTDYYTHWAQQWLKGKKPAPSPNVIMPN